MIRIYLTVIANFIFTGLIAQAYADGRGEVIATKDSATVKIWSMKDCKLVASMGKESPEWYAKQVRHKFLYAANPDELSREFVLSPSTTEDRYRIMRRKTEVGYITMPENSVQSEDYCSANDKLLLRGITNNKATIWIFDPKVSTTDVKVFDKFKVDKDAYINPAWSPKGNYIICVSIRKIWNTATGKSVSISADYELNGFAPHRFNAEEDKVSIATNKGITVIDPKTGKVLAEYAIPAHLKTGKEFTVTACSDGKSFLFSYGDALSSGSPGASQRKVWLITEGKVACEFLY